MLPLGLVRGACARMARAFAAKPLVEAAVALPLVLPPTVLGYYLLVAFNPGAPIGGAFLWLTGEVLAFSFPGLVTASIIFNLPFAILPMQQAFAAIPHEVREAAWVSGLSGSGDARAHRAADRLAGRARGVRADVRPHPRRVRGGADGRGQHPLPDAVRCRSRSTIRCRRSRWNPPELLSALLLGASLVAMALVRALGGRAVRVRVWTGPPCRCANPQLPGNRRNPSGLVRTRMRQRRPP